jgi:hypothetical protein
MISPSICIPRVDNSITKCQIYGVFNRYNFGPISRIDIVNKNNNTRVFIHFNYWFDNQKNSDIKDRLLSGAPINIIYTKPWFWKCSVSKILKP